MVGILASVLTLSLISTYKSFLWQLWGQWSWAELAILLAVQAASQKYVSKDHGMYHICEIRPNCLPENSVLGKELSIVWVHWSTNQSLILHWEIKPRNEVHRYCKATVDACMLFKWNIYYKM